MGQQKGLLTLKKAATHVTTKNRREPMIIEHSTNSFVDLSIRGIKAICHETDTYLSSFLRQLFTFFSQITAKSHHSGLPMLDITPYCHSPHRCAQAMGREASDDPRQIFCAGFCHGVGLVVLPQLGEFACSNIVVRQQADFFPGPGQGGDEGGCCLDIAVISIDPLDQRDADLNIRATPSQCFQVFQNPLVAGPGPLLVFLRVHQFQIVEKQIRTFGNVQQDFGLGQAGSIDRAVYLQPAASIKDFLQKPGIHQRFATGESNPTARLIEK